MTPNQFQIHSDFLEPEIALETRQLAYSQPLPFTQRTKKWSDNIIRDSTEVCISATCIRDKPEVLAIIESRVRKLVGLANPEVRCGMQVYKWNPGSYIPWHTDGRYHFGFTLCLNQRWNQDWGGELLIQAPESNGGCQGCYVAPAMNRLVVLGNDVLHRTTVVAADAEPRYSIQGFFLR